MKQGRFERRLWVNTEVMNNGDIVTTTAFEGFLGEPVKDIMRQVLCTRELQVREALIRLGWTPPAEARANVRGELSPGPWHWKTGTYQTLVDANGDDVLWYTTSDDGVHCKEGDKRVIAASRELLAACESLLSFAEEYAGKNTFAEERAAIAKARG